MQTEITQESKPRQIRKRDGVTLQQFDATKIENAIRKAWQATDGVSVDENKLRAITVWVVNTVGGAEVGIEKIQDAVEIALMRFDLYPVAKEYILYRQKRAEARSARKDPDPKAISDYIHAAKYAKYLAELLRREIYVETVNRSEEMHVRRFKHIQGMEALIRDAFVLVREQRVLPSMRSMQFGGVAIEDVNNRIYNCSATHVDRLEAFSQAFYLLLCGCGVGYSVQFEHVDKLPELVKINDSKVVHHVVADSIAGWANALKALLYSYVDGTYIEFSYHLIRAEGSPLKISGGKAPGHIGLKKALEAVRVILDGAQGRHLRPIECHEIMCLVADAVLSGGIRRSSLIALFSLEDSEMMNAKIGDWFKHKPWFKNANNSVILKRDEVKRAQFERIFQMTKQFGEPGFIFVADKDEVRNPCAEIALNCKLVITHEVMKMLKDRVKRGKPMPDVKLGEIYTGFAFCNLCELNAAKFETFDDFVAAAHAATLIGTLQASYTDMPYLGWVSEVIAEREALLGIGMTGIMDAPEIANNPVYQREVATHVVEWNTEFAEMIGIRPAARTTTIKPSGTTALELGCVASGQHLQHARRFLRRVTANELESVFQHFKVKNPHMCVRMPNGDWSIEFPVKAPDKALVKRDFSAIQFLDIVKSTQLNWVVPGTARPESSPGYVHNVSNTVHVAKHEWPLVIEYLWQNKGDFSGVSFIHLDDKVYPFMPFDEVVTEADEARWNQLIAHYQPVDYLTLVEKDDTTKLTQEPACAGPGGACEITR